MVDELGGEREPKQILRDMQRQILALQQDVTGLRDRGIPAIIRPTSSEVGTIIETAEITGFTENRNGVANAAFTARRIANEQVITVEVYMGPEPDGHDLQFSAPRFRVGDEIPVYADLADGTTFFLVGLQSNICSST